MKKKTLALLAFLIALVAAYFVFVYKWHGPDNEFQITDPNQVGKIEMERFNAGKSVVKLVLVCSEDGTWHVNGKYLANESKVREFLKTLTDIRVYEKIPDKGQASALGLLKRNHLHVNILDLKGSMLKDYLVGPTNSQQTANIFKMEFSDKCYMVSRPATNGYVSIQYSTDEIDWRDMAIWDIQGKDLNSVSAKYRIDTTGSSFTLKREGDHWSLGDAPADANRVSAYLSLFQGKINAESFADQRYPDMMDSLKRRQPDVTYSLATQDGKALKLLLFTRAESSANLFGYLDGSSDLLTVQYYVIDPFLKRKDYFVASQQ